jgi:hypothetical protein
METKATRLEKLSSYVQVPAFVRISKQSVLNLDDVPHWEQYIVRSVSGEEDQDQSSHAGQFITIGPIKREGIADAIKCVFQQATAVEVIVQEYKQGISGVAFCFDESFFYIEYSAYPEGVTSGKNRPFVAIFPARQGSQYEKLHQELLKIYKQFGSSDVEFIGINDPAFVQVRPITSEFDVDREMVTLQMGLQDSISGKWIENDLGQVIGEHKSHDSLFVSYYMQSLTLVFKQYFKRDVGIAPHDVINVGSQYFVSESFINSTKLGRLDLLKFAFIFHREQERLKKIDVKNTSLEELFEKSILSSMAYTLLKKKEFFNIREKYRQVIDEFLAQGNFSVSEIRRFPYNGQLDSIIELDRDLAVWIAIKKRDSFGIQVVPGEFDPTKFFSYQEGEKIPDGAVVLCDNLYPDIGKNIDTIQGIICANGSINSHVSILCRERNIPLVIQADIEHYC